MPHDPDRETLVPPVDDSFDGPTGVRRTKARSEMTERELLLALHERMDQTDKWRTQTDKRLASGDAEIGMSLNAIQTLCKLLGASEAAGELAAYIHEKRLRANGGQHEAPTNPENERPDE